VVFQGNNVKDEDSYHAFFNDLGSAPSTISAGHFADFYGMLPGNVVEQADAVRAYTQAPLMGTKTWVRIPREEWPKEWKGMRDPVCPLRLALYGHPDSGSCWEVWNDAKMREIGFRPIDGWSGCYFHDKKKALLTVYVDDFKMAGPKKSVAELWKLISQRIELEDPTPPGRYLGCMHKACKLEILEDEQPMAGLPGIPASSGGQPLSKDGSVESKKKCTVNGMVYDLSSFVSQCLDLYEELAGPNFRPYKKVGTPFVAEAEGSKKAEDEEPGALASIALRVLMKVFYAARVGRYDIMKAVTYLAKKVLKLSLIHI